MIRLGLSPEPYWLDLPDFELRLKVRPLTTALAAAARSKAAREVTQAAEQFKAVREAGGEITGLPDLGDLDARAGLAESAFVKAVGRAAIFEWEGVFLADGSKAPVDDATVGELLGMFPIGERFLAAYFARLDLIESEKNVSGPAADGISAVGPTTARPAGTADSPAPTAASASTESAAPTPSTSR